LWTAQVPTNFSIAARELISSAAGTSSTKLADPPVFSSEPLVEAGLVLSGQYPIATLEKRVLNMIGSLV
jgi:hypothetical protein